MKNLFGLLITCLLMSGTSYAQESREADAERLRSAREVNAKNTDRRTVGVENVEIYTKIDLIFVDDKLTIESSRSEGKIGNTYASERYPEIDRLTKTKYSVDSEIDILNFMGENQWKLITVIVNTADEKTTKSMYFSKTIPATKGRTTTRESAPTRSSAPAQRTPPAQR